MKKNYNLSDNLTIQVHKISDIYLLTHCPVWVTMVDWPHPTWAYFWPAVLKIADPKRFFLTPKGKFFDVLGEIFQTQTQTIDGWPDPSHKKLTQPESKNFD